MADYSITPSTLFDYIYLRIVNICKSDFLQSLISDELTKYNDAHIELRNPTKVLEMMHVALVHDYNEWIKSITAHHYTLSNIIKLTDTKSKVVASDIHEEFETYQSQLLNYDVSKQKMVLRYIAVTEDYHRLLRNLMEISTSLKRIQSFDEKFLSVYAEEDEDDHESTKKSCCELMSFLQQQQDKYADFIKDLTNTWAEYGEENI